MASPSESSYHASGSGLTRRTGGSASRVAPDSLRPDVEPPPRPKPGMQKLAIIAIVALGCIQLFLSPTHFRDPKDPHRSWIPIDPTSSTPISKYPRSEEQSSSAENQEVEVPGIHIFSWTDCLNLPMLAVLTNSTLSTSRYPEDVFFHFFIPPEEDDKLSYYKLKVVLPKSNLEIVGQKGIKERLELPNLEGVYLQTFLLEVAPLIVPKSHLSLSKYVYISPDAIIKGQIEDLYDIDLGPYAIGSAEDCKIRLGEFVNIEVLNAIQRTAAKSWVSKKPYDKDACTPDFNVVLVDPRKLDNTLTEAVWWWTKVLDLDTARGNHIRLAMALALYEKYQKLPPSWKLENSINDEKKVTRFDGPRTECRHYRTQQQSPHNGETWQQYLHSKSVAILTH
ncbi:Glycosyl transferase family 8 [Carex littledalei]|uniref:Hexosyltransferase n=1 Tax=Carex littledalei TaxID=544730 RepID=A0A833VEF3_9POAL|nr:Glycosyl transferase family 8 [Carex littledalei]